MPRVKGLAFVSLFVLALSAQPVLSQDRNSDQPPTPTNPQNNPTAKPPRHRADGDHHRSRRKPDSNSSAQGQNNDQNKSANGQQSGRRRGPPPGSPPANPSAPQGTGGSGHADDNG